MFAKKAAPTEINFQPANFQPGDKIMSKNLEAFRDMLAWAEGTDRPEIQRSNHKGYDVIVGGGLFTDFSKHPRVLVSLPRYGIKSSAAGRYQFIHRTWETLRVRLRLPDFGPASQDKACDELLREKGAIELIEAGKFDEAVRAVRSIWASLPGAGYGQREQKLKELRDVYVRNGGKLA